MRKIWLVAGFTLRELVRRRALLVMGISGLLIIGFFGLVMAEEYREATQRLEPVQAQAMAWMAVRMVLGLLSLLVSITGLFLAAGSISGDAESSHLHVLLPRTITRTQVFIGKLAAIGTAIMGFCLLLTAGVGLSLVLVGAGWPPGWHWLLLGFPVPPLLLVAVALTCNTRLTAAATGMVTVMLYVIAQVGNALEAFGTTMGSSGMETAGILISLAVPTDAVYRWVIQQWTDALGASGLLVRFGNVTAAPPSVWMLLWAAGWLLAVVAVGARSFRSKEL